MIKPAILLFGFFLFATAAWTQNIASNNQTVIGGNASLSSTELPFFTSSEDAQKIVAGILYAIGVEGNFKIKVADVPNVEATIRHHERYILYNPQFVNSVNAVARDKWA